MTWTSRNQLWGQLSPFQRATAMSFLEADWRNGGIDLASQRNALGAILNRAHRKGKGSADFLGHQVGTRIYQPSFEPAQEARLQRILNHPNFKSEAHWAQRRWSGQEADPVGGATHFLAHPQQMLALERKNPAKYRNWGPRGQNWTGYNPQTGQYANQTISDASHSFLAPGGKYSIPQTEGAVAGAGSVAPITTEKKPMTGGWGGSKKSYYIGPNGRTEGIPQHMQPQQYVPQDPYGGGIGGMLNRGVSSPLFQFGANLMEGNWGQGARAASAAAQREHANQIRLAQALGANGGDFSKTFNVIDHADGTQSLVQPGKGGGALFTPLGGKKNEKTQYIKTGLETQVRKPSQDPHGRSITMTEAEAEARKIKLADHQKFKSGFRKAVDQYGYRQQEDTNTLRMINNLTAKVDQGAPMGWKGTALNYAKDPEARNFNELVATVKARIGFGKLNEMRQNSPTGGALGNVTERELAFLQAVEGSLDTAQSPEELKAILKQIAQAKVRFMELRADAYSADQQYYKNPDFDPIKAYDKQSKALMEQMIAEVKRAGVQSRNIAPNQPARPAGPQSRLGGFGAGLGSALPSGATYRRLP